MSFRTPPNKGVVEFPAVFHVRCTIAMRDEVKARGGGNWLRSLIAANTRPPADKVTTADAGAFADDEPPFVPDVSPSIEGDTRRRVPVRKMKSVTRNWKKALGAGGYAKKPKRVSLDKRKRRTV